MVICGVKWNVQQWIPIFSINKVKLQSHDLKSIHKWVFKGIPIRIIGLSKNDGIIDGFSEEVYSEQGENEHENEHKYD